MSSFIRILLVLFPFYGFAQQQSTYLQTVKQELKKEWPNNRTINLVFHGHSVPTGYFRTPLIKTFDSYPFLLLRSIKDQYPTASVNAIRTSIGGENSEQGAKRFVKEVLCHRPDVLFIDYALNDRSIGLERSRKAMEQMIKQALKKQIKVILLTPSPDIQTNILDENNPLEQLSKQIRQLAEQYQVGLVDVYAKFKAIAQQGGELKDYMAQSNHPNEKGHQVIANEIMNYFN